MQVTVTGGHGQSPAVLSFDANDLALLEGKTLAASIDATYTSAIYYNPTTPPTGPAGAYLIIPTAYATSIINATGFGAVVDENNGVGSTITGGGYAGGQSVLAGDGGLTFSASVGAVTVVAGGGSNYVTFAGDTSDVAVYTSIGNDIIVGGDGETTIAAGGGHNTITLGSGTSYVSSTGADTISLGAGGNDTISVSGAGSDQISGNAIQGADLTFYNGDRSSSVTVGAGSGTIYGGVGGGKFIGGTSGDNSIVAGSGTAKIYGGGTGDTLLGGSGAATIFASTGNETLGAGTGSVLFDLAINNPKGTTGTGVTDTITNFSSLDLLNVGGPKGTSLALHSYEIVGGSGTFLLQDGAQVVLEGYTGTLTASDFTLKT